MKRILIFPLLFLCFALNLKAQTKQVSDFGFRLFRPVFLGDTIDVLMKSAAGDEQKVKPLFFFCQGSLPEPLIKTTGKDVYGVFPFNIDSIIKSYHLIIVSKPYIPLIVDVKLLGPNFMYVNPKTGRMVPDYSKRNLLDYYVVRNNFVIDYFQKQAFIDANKCVVAGHSQGGVIGAKMAASNVKVTHLIYSSENPFGQIVSMLQQYRALESDTDSTRYSTEIKKYWEGIIANKESMDDIEGDTYKSVYGFSISHYETLQKLKIPVLVCYGTKDFNAPYLDFFMLDMMRQQKKNFTFNAYIGLEHNFFGFKPSGEIDTDNFNWDKVALDWLKWTKNTK